MIFQTSFASSEVQELIKNSNEGSVDEMKLKSEANHMFKIATQNGIEPSYHHTIAIMERYAYDGEDRGDEELRDEK